MTRTGRWRLSSPPPPPARTASVSLSSYTTSSPGPAPSSCRRRGRSPQHHPFLQQQQPPSPCSLRQENRWRSPALLSSVCFPHLPPALCPCSGKAHMHSHYRHALLTPHEECRRMASPRRDTKRLTKESSQAGPWLQRHVHGHRSFPPQGAQKHTLHTQTRERTQAHMRKNSGEVVSRGNRMQGSRIRFDARASNVSLLIMYATTASSLCTPTPTPPPLLLLPSPQLRPLSSPSAPTCALPPCLLLLIPLTQPAAWATSALLACFCTEAGRLSGDTAWRGRRWSAGDAEN